MNDRRFSRLNCGVLHLLIVPFLFNLKTFRAVGMNPLALHRRLPLGSAAALWLVTLLLSSALSAGQLSPATVPLSPDGTMHISPEDRCPVCAMRPAKYPQSACAIQLADGRTFYFCDTGCMLRSWLHPDIYLGVGKDALKRAVVREYFTGAYLDGSAAIWVAGSDVIGPMGPMIVPLDGEDHVRAFQRRHGGKTLFRLEDLTETLWKKVFHRHP